MEIDLPEGTADPTPSPSPGPSPTPPKPKPKGWQVPLEPPPRVSKALADYIIAARSVFQDLADTLGTPKYAVPPPKSPPVAPPSLPSNETTRLTGFAAATYSTFQGRLQGHSAAWHGTDGTALTTAQQAATIGATALQQIKDLVYRLQDTLNAANLDRAVPASYTERPSTGSLASYAEYKLAITIERTLQQAIEVFSRAQMDLGVEVALTPLVPVIPLVPEGMVPPGPVPMPQPQPYSRDPGVMEV
ncbi:hypothetical protein ACWEKR_20920 [Nocardia sp. NPDC004573]